MAAGVVVVLATRRPRPEPPSLLLVTIDTLRADHLGAYGYAAGTSPAIDRLFAEGTGFPTVLVPRGQTWPTLASLLTSQYPVTHGVRRNGLHLEEGAVTLGHVLSEEGWRCAAMLAHSRFAGWPGFTTVVGRPGEDVPLARAAAEWIRVNASRRFFLWVHLFAPHRPYDPPRPLAERFDPGYRGPVDGSTEQIEALHVEQRRLEGADRRHLVALYDGEIRFVDRLVGDLLAELAEAGIEERTLVVFTADHGEELGERSFYLSHSASVYDCVLRAPLLFRWPGRIPEGRWVEGIAETIDVAPTILELVGVRAPEAFRGTSLAAAVRGQTGTTGKTAAFSELEDRAITVRTPEWRYVHNPDGVDFPLREGSSVPIGCEELFALGPDPGETANVVAGRAGEAARLREAILRWQERHDWEEASRRFRDREVPERVREELEALGYVR